MLSDGRKRTYPLATLLAGAAFLSGVIVLTLIGSFIVVRALVEWLT